MQVKQIKGRKEMKIEKEMETDDNSSLIQYV